MLFKTAAIILSTLFIAMVQISTADASCRPGHGAKKSLYQKQALQQSRARKAAQSRAVAAAKQKKAVQQARAEKTEPAKVAASTPAEETKEVAEGTDSSGSALAVASVEQTCTKFVAETGTTVTVKCAKQ